MLVVDSLHQQHRLSHLESADLNMRVSRNIQFALVKLHRLNTIASRFEARENAVHRGIRGARTRECSNAVPTMRRSYYLYMQPDR